jgi:hypothetical protein
MTKRSETANQIKILIGLAAGALAGLVGGAAAVGSPLKLPVMLTIFFGGFGSGASFAVFIVQRKMKRGSQ